MTSNVIAFTARPANDNRTAMAHAVSGARDNVVMLAGWIGRAIPRRTPNGVFFTSTVLVTGGDIA